MSREIEKNAFGCHAPFAVKRFLLFFFFFFRLDAMPTICLNMIVRNESHVIERCLKSVKPFIDSWAIVDTGSTDGTQEIIRKVMQDLPGELYESPWVNFEHNRNEALHWAKGKGDYLLFIDADEELLFSEEFKKPSLDKDFYFIIVRQDSGFEFKRVFLINNHLEWVWKGVLHEEIWRPWVKDCALLEGAVILTREEGFRSRDPQKYQKDAQILEEALQKDPTNCRYTFYLAQSYLNAKEYALALRAYEKRAAMKGWDEEVFWALYMVAQLQGVLNFPSETILESYKKAYEFRPSRAEPLYRIACLYEKERDFAAAFELSQFGLSIPLPQDLSYVERWIYEYGFLAQLADDAFYLERYAEAASFIQRALKCNLPLQERSRLEGNLSLLMFFSK